MSSLLAHEVGVLKTHEKVEEKAFQMKGESSYKGKSENFGSRGYGRGGFRGGRGRSGGRGRGQFGDQRSNKSFLQCHYCQKFDQKEANCWSKEKNDQKQANFVEKVDEESKLFIAYSTSNNESDGVWFVDSRCSNHMIGDKTLFKNLDESLKSEV